VDTSEVFLKRNALIEPLYNRWYAWSYLLSPATAAMFVANQQVKLMQSFVASPQVHASVLKDPAMRGGPFLDVDPRRVADVKAILDETVKRQAHMIEFAEAVKAFDKVLADEAKGFSLEALYRKVPTPLPGYVELVYDGRDNASMRFIEALLFKSKYHVESAQQLHLSLMRPDQRDFVLATPRLASPGNLMLDVAFSREAVDRLFRMRYQRARLGEIREALGVRSDEAELFRGFFTTEEPRPRERFLGDGVRVRYFGHATLLVETAGVNLMFDPVVSYDVDGGGQDRFTHADVPEQLDYVFITHNHQDHVMFEPLLELRHRIKTIVVPRSGGGSLADPSLKLILTRLGFGDVRELGELEELPIEGGSVLGVPFLGEHGDLDIRTKLAYCVRLQGRQLLMMADSNNVEPALYDHLHACIGDVDALFIGMECDGAPISWLYGPLFTRPIARKNDQSRRFDGSDYDKAIKIVDRFRPKEAYVYAMGQEPWLRHLMNVVYSDESRPIVESNRLTAECRARGMKAERLYLKKELHF
jgi:L-ascorbate metabolism protein UlaG (beta-lactamase superfamily)